MGAETSGLNSHSNESHKDATSTLSAVRLHPDPLLPQLGLSAGTLQQAPIHFPFSPPFMGVLSVSEKDLQIWAAGDLMEGQVPVPAAPAVDTCRRSGRSQVGCRREERVREKEAGKKASCKQSSSLNSNPRS